MTNEQRKNILRLGLASRKASELYGAHKRYANDIEVKHQAEDAYAAFMAAIYEATGGSDGSEAE